MKGWTNFKPRNMLALRTKPPLKKCMPPLPETSSTYTSKNLMVLKKRSQSQNGSPKYSVPLRTISAQEKRVVNKLYVKVISVASDCSTIAK
mmetsp:Transcript_32408/g.62575  ORF Transcript_32408/g.62575 Transcript_32408/m.62575 type:complete len:91 (+) Transcript_32408:891-1163(+)